MSTCPVCGARGYHAWNCSLNMPAKSVPKEIGVACPQPDLPTRLRAESKKFMDDDNCGLLLLEEAADEIDRLQRRISELENPLCREQRDLAIAAERHRARAFRKT